MARFDTPDDKHFESPEALEAYFRDQIMGKNGLRGYRGHGNAEWELKTTIARYVEMIKAAFPDKKGHHMGYDGLLENITMQLKKIFRENLIINNDLPQDQIEKIDLWQYGQHFGLPSPLLDWSYSPYVALFFALSDNTAENIKRCVWILDLELLRVINQNVVEHRTDMIEKQKNPEYWNKFLPTMEIRQEVFQHNRRLSFQRGFFTLLEHTFSIEVWIKRVCRSLHFNATNQRFLTKLTFSCTKEQRLNMLDRLDIMNINNRTLFPDIQGSVKDAQDRVLRSYLTEIDTRYDLCHIPDARNEQPPR